MVMQASQLGRLLEQHREKIHRVARRLTSRVADAEDIAQDVAVTVLEKGDQFRGESEWATWVHRVTVNAALMQKRRQKVRRAVSLEESGLEFLSNGQCWGPVGSRKVQPEEAALRPEVGRALGAAIESLPGGYREILVMADVDGLGNGQIAAITKLSVPAVKSRLHRARANVRGRLAGLVEN